VEPGERTLQWPGLAFFDPVDHLVRTALGDLQGTSYAEDEEREPEESK
jgi:hypothetical protein